MLKKRVEAADAVASEFLKAERVIDEAAQSAAVCVATMLAQRASAGLPVATGLDALQAMSEVASDLIRVREKAVQAHRMLVDVRRDIGLARMYGDPPCPPASAVDRSSPPILAVVA